MLAIWKSISGFVGGIAGNYINYLMIGGMVVIATAAGIFYWQWTRAADRVAEQQLTLDRQQSEIAALNFRVAAKELSIQVLESTNSILSDQAEGIGKIQEEINNAPETDDAPIAPVLERALRNLGRVSAQPAKPN